MRFPLNIFKLAVVLFMILLRTTESATAVEPGPAGGGMLTPWGEVLLQQQAAGPVLPHLEYPRPTLIRDRWRNLNGRWDIFLPDADGKIHVPDSAVPNHPARSILVPFPAGSVLSGVPAAAPQMHYRTLFTIPADWSGNRVHLHFGAVDWGAVVYVNGREVGRHLGGYTPFFLDITEAIHAIPASDQPDSAAQSNLLDVIVFDPTQSGDQIRGKQSTEPTGIWYGASSGIWQSVWLEPVPASHVRRIETETDIRTGTVDVRLDVSMPKPNHFVAVEIFAGEESIAELYGGLNGPLRLAIPVDKLVLWTPDSPFLYTIVVRLLEGETAIDRVQGYFAARTVAILPDENGYRRVNLNDRPIFLQGIIDQGYWPDGMYTAPSDAAVESDIRTMKSLGFNTIRKHAKVESERWYAWCDRIGMLVWQDIPNGNNGTTAAQHQFERELAAIVDARRRHPSIVVWTLFNEGRGQHRTAELVALLRKLDPDRLIDAASGWKDYGVGDFNDVHQFPGPAMPPQHDPNRASVLGSYGGITLIVPGHLWTEETWGYRHATDSEALLREYRLRNGQLRELLPRGLAAAAFHQFTDVESECNGLVTYDRRRLKIPPEDLKEINRISGRDRNHPGIQFPAREESLPDGPGS
ncbi:MAG TPA: beta-galactosidase [Planctomycetaceae bacterium]|nr:beta-galactosidase [Planctomycetaceae bacterium]